MNTQSLFEILRIAARDGNAISFIDNKDQLPSLNQRQLTDLIEIIVVTPDRQHFLLHLFEAGINFNNQLILERLGEKATDWTDALTQSVVTLMILGVKWSEEAYQRSNHVYELMDDQVLKIDEYSISISKSKIEPSDIYSPECIQVARIRSKMHLLFNSNQTNTKKIWDYAHKFFFYCCEHGLKKCIDAMFLFRWPANIVILDKKLLHEPRATPSAQLPIASVSLENKDVATIQPKAYRRFIDVNYQNEYGQTALELASENNQTTLVECLRKKGAKQNHISPNKVDSLIGKIIGAIRTDNYEMYITVINNKNPELRDELIKLTRDKLREYQRKCEGNKFFTEKHQTYFNTLDEFINTHFKEIVNPKNAVNLASG